MVILILGVNCCRALAVSEATACLFLTISPSPQAIAMGSSYGAAATTSPMAAIMNPAALGLFGRHHFFGQEYYPEEIAWLPQLGGDMTYDAQATAIGINLRQFSRIPISIGVARTKVALDLGILYRTSESSPEPIESSFGFENSEGTSLALAVDYFLRVSLGFTWKRVNSHLAPLSAAAEAQLDAKDWGLMLQAPLVEMGRKTGVLKPGLTPVFDFWLDPGFYYSKTNIGDKVVYIDAAQADPLPRTLSMGLNLQAGVRYRGLILAGFSWSREMDDLLLERDRDGSFRYLDAPPDLRFWDNVVRGKANSGTVRKCGHEINLADFYFLRSGTYEDIAGRASAGTSGYGISFLQPLRIAAVIFKRDNTRWGRILSRISFEKHHAEYEKDAQYPFTGQTFNSYLLKLSGFPILD